MGERKREILKSGKYFIHNKKEKRMREREMKKKRKEWKMKQSERAKMKLISSATRFGEILPLWQNLKSL